MPNPYLTQIPAPRVPLVNERTGSLTREWYLFFLNLYNLTGTGSNVITLDDLQITPVTNVDQIIDNIVDQTQLEPVTNLTELINTSLSEAQLSYQSQSIPETLEIVEPSPPSIPINFKIASSKFKLFPPFSA